MRKAQDPPLNVFKRSPRPWVWVKVLVSLILFLFLFHSIGVGEILESGTIRHWSFLIPSIAGVFLTIFLNALPFYWVGRQYDLSLWNAVLAAARCWTWGMLTPGRLGEFTVVHELGKRGVPHGEIGLLSIVMRLATLLVLLLLCLSAWCALVLPHTAVAATLLALLLLSAGIVLIFRLPLLHWLCRVLPRFLSKHVDPRTSFLHSLPLVLAIILSQLARMVVLFSITVALFWSVEFPVSFLQVGAVNAIAWGVALIPVSLNGLGLREGVQVVFYDLWFQVPKEVVLSVALWANALAYAVAAFLWVTVVNPPRNWKFRA